MTRLTLQFCSLLEKRCSLLESCARFRITPEVEGRLSEIRVMCSPRTTFDRQIFARVYFFDISNTPKLSREFTEIPGYFHLGRFWPSRAYTPANSWIATLHGSGQEMCPCHPVVEIPRRKTPEIPFFFWRSLVVTALKSNARYYITIFFFLGEWRFRGAGMIFMVRLATVCNVTLVTIKCDVGFHF